MPTLTMFGRFSVATRCGAAIPGFSTALVTPNSMDCLASIVDSQPAQNHAILKNAGKTLDFPVNLPV